MSCSVRKTGLYSLRQGTIVPVLPEVTEMSKGKSEDSHPDTRLRPVLTTTRNAFPDSTWAAVSQSGTLEPLAAKLQGLPSRNSTSQVTPWETESAFK